MNKLVLLLLCFISTDLWAEEAQEFSIRVYETILKKDFKTYTNLLHPNCSLKDFSKKTFEMRSDLLKNLNPGAKTEVISLVDYQRLQIRNGNSTKYTYSVEPSHYIIVWPLESLPSRGARIDLNPIVKEKDGWKIIDGSCISATAESGSADLGKQALGIINYSELSPPSPFSKAWDVRLQATEKQRFQIVRLTSKKDSLQGTPSESKVVFTSKDLQKNPGDQMYFRISLSSEAPTQNMNGPSQMGMGLSFSRIGGGYGTSNWIVFPGTKLISIQPNKSGNIKDDRLLFLTIESEDSMGKQYRTNLELQTL